MLVTISIVAPAGDPYTHLAVGGGDDTIYPKTFRLAGGSVRMAGNPITLSDHHDSYAPPPLLGQHTDEVLCALGKAEPELAQLRAAGVICSRYFCRAFSAANQRELARIM